MKEKISGTVLIMLLILVIGIVLSSIGFCLWRFAPNLLPDNLYSYMLGSGLLLIFLVLNIAATAFVKPDPWHKTRKNLFIGVTLLLTLVTGLILTYYGAYYSIQVFELQRGFKLIIFGGVFLGIFSTIFTYILWKNWYEWERKILKLLVPYSLLSIIVLVIVIVLIILGVIKT